MSNQQKIIVSLTSFPEAIPYAVQAIRSVLKGSFLPDKIVLYLDTQKFPGKILPAELEGLKAESPIFEVRFDPAEIRSYKKLLPALKDFPNDVIVTIDDDILYHPNLLRDLVSLHKRLPDAIQPFGYANGSRRSIVSPSLVGRKDARPCTLYGIGTHER